MAAEKSFSLKSDLYASNRPTYPAALFDWIVFQCKTRNAAWDCATGNGQAAQDLATYFKKIHATDISPQQLDNSFLKNNITYSQSAAEETSFEDQTFDLITVAQALHWFDHDKFWQEVIRTARKNAFFCAWGYSWFTCDADIMEVLVNPFLTAVDPYWAPQLKTLWDGYQPNDLDFPFDPIDTPPFSIEMHWTLEELIKYMKTWSGYKKAMEQNQSAALLSNIVDGALKSFPAGKKLKITMPLFIIAGYVR